MGLPENQLVRSTMPILCCRVIVLVLFLLYGSSLHGGQEDIEKILQILDQQIENAVDNKEKAKFCCFRARNYHKLNQEEDAEQSYLEALEYDFSGWILMEYCTYLFKMEEYERSYRAAHTVLKEFPQFSSRAEKLKKQSAQRYREEYYTENPPTIIIDSKIDPYRVTRHDLMRRQGSRQPVKVHTNYSATKTSPVVSSTKTTTRRVRKVRS